MNIFWLHDDYPQLVKLLADVHVNKMLLEHCQMLSTAHWIHSNGANHDFLSQIYKPTHPNHPCTKWAAANNQNYLQLHIYTRYLASEWKFRKKVREGLEQIPADQIHKSIKVLKILEKSPEGIPQVTEPTLPPLCMPDNFIAVHRDNSMNNIVEAYRDYYISKETTMRVPMKWSGRERPAFMDDGGIIAQGAAA